LKTTNGDFLHQGRRKTGFLGFLICINSAQILYKTLCQDKDVLKYIPFYKLNQDYLELLFSCIRSRGGGNNNPTTRQFIAAIMGAGRGVQGGALAPPWPWPMK